MSIELLEPPVVPPEDLPVPDGFELVNGELRETGMSFEASVVAGELLGRLWLFNREKRLGHVFPANAVFRCFPQSRKTARKPDVSFVLQDRLPGPRLPPGDSRIAPDLAVEVVSPSDTVQDLNEKVNDYLTAGVRLIWVIDPEARSAMVRRPNRTATPLAETDLLDGEDVLPGFTCPLADILPPLS